MIIFALSTLATQFISAFSCVRNHQTSLALLIFFSLDQDFRPLFMFDLPFFVRSLLFRFPSYWGFLASPFSNPYFPVPLVLCWSLFWLLCHRSLLSFFSISYTSNKSWWIYYPFRVLSQYPRFSSPTKLVNLGVNLYILPPVSTDLLANAHYS